MYILCNKVEISFVGTPSVRTSMLGSQGCQILYLSLSALRTINHVYIFLGQQLNETIASGGAACDRRCFPVFVVSKSYYQRR